MLPAHQSLPDSLSHAFAATDTTVAVWPGMTTMADSIHEVRQVTQGVAGEPIPYNPRTDDVVTVALLLSTFFALWVVVHSWGFIVRSATAFVYDLLPRRVIHTEGTDIEEAGDSRLLHLQISFLGALAYVCYVRNQHIEAFTDKGPYQLLCIGFLLFLGWYMLRTALYKFINSIFFEPWQHTLWVQARTQCTFLSALFLLPLLLIEVYFAPPAIAYSICILFIVGIGRFSLLMKCYSTFFTYRGGVLHLFLYFCTLEIAPLIVLWRLLGAST